MTFRFTLRVAAQAGYSWAHCSRALQFCHNEDLTKRKSKPRRSALSLDARQLHLIARALADPRRFEIFQRIAATPLFISCAQLREAVDITPATMSHHLRELENAGLVNAVRDGRFMNLSLRREIWRAYIAELENL